MTLKAKRLPHAVLFDWDNTLVDTTHDTVLALNAVCKTFGMPPITLGEFQQKPSLTLRALLRDMVPEENLVEAESIFFKHIPSAVGVVLLPHAHTIIHGLHRLNIPTAVVSNKEGPRLRSEIAKLHLSEFFYCAVGSGDTPEDKPSSVPLLHALAHKKIRPSENVWFVGDSVVDMMCAKAAGCTPVSVAPQADSFPHPKIKVENCHGLWKLVQSFLPT